MIRLRSVRRFQGESGRALHGEVQTKLILIPLIFVLLRVPGVVFRFGEIAAHAEYWILLPFMAFGNASQGIADCLVYVVFTSRARELFQQTCSYVFVRRRTASINDYDAID